MTGISYPAHGIHLRIGMSDQPGGSPTDPTASHVLSTVDPTRPRVLVVWEGGSISRSLPDTGSLVIGRALEAEIRIDHASVSRRHAILHCGAPARIEDLGSSNGTSIAGVRITPNDPRALAPGDVFEVGAATLVVQAPTRVDGSAAGGLPSTQKLVELVARSHLDVVLLGETGVGKEITAETIHRRSARKEGPFVRVNCAALPDTLLEAELFGHEKGAFTGATQQKPGLFEAAHGGTLFLDEVSEMALATQAKLLRAVESREVTRLGSVKPMRLDIRIIAATNRNIGSDVAVGRFRADLYFRLAGMTITVAPLRERANEIPRLAQLFVEEACRASQLGGVRLSGEALQCLSRHGWPGNIRELRRVVERAVVLCESDVIQPAHLVFDVIESSERGSVPSGTASGDPVAALQREVFERERKRIAEALAEAGGNQSRAAEILGVSRRTLINWLDEYDLPRPRKGKP
jgi:two-component system response regulator AtoC